MEPDEIFKRFGVTDTQLRAYMTRLSTFLESLDDVEKKMFLASVRTDERALRASGSGATSEALTEFLEAGEILCGTIIMKIRAIVDIDKGDA